MGCGLHAGVCPQGLRVAAAVEVGLHFRVLRAVFQSVVQGICWAHPAALQMTTMLMPTLPDRPAALHMATLILMHSKMVQCVYLTNEKPAPS